MLTLDDLIAFVDQHFRRSAFRLELLDAYEVASDGTDFARYLAGEPSPTPERVQPWIDQLRAERAAGVVRQRVHVLRRPLSPYLRYECEWAYTLNAAEGEDVRILDVSGRPDLTEALRRSAKATRDFWIFDDRWPVVMHYDNAGQFVGADVDQDVQPYREARDLTVRLSEPFTGWWAAHPDEHRSHREHSAA